MNSYSDLQFIKRFKVQWPTINLEIVEQRVHNSLVNLLQFGLSFLRNTLYKGDYKKLLELTMLILGRIILVKVHFTITEPFITADGWLKLYIA